MTIGYDCIRHFIRMIRWKLLQDVAHIDVKALQNKFDQFTAQELFEITHCP